MTRAHAQRRAQSWGRWKLTDPCDSAAGSAKDTLVCVFAELMLLDSVRSLSSSTVFNSRADMERSI